MSIHFFASLRVRRWLFGFRLMGALTVFALMGSAAAEPEATNYPPVKLRGYGTLSGTFTTGIIDDQPVSTLQITCEDEAKAQLVVAKYLSDLQALPGTNAITISARATTIPGFEVPDLGVFLASRDGAIVSILCSPSQATEVKLVEAYFAANHNPLKFAPEVKVPMYLDRWDKYGFRFYYAPFTIPPKPAAQSIGDYDPNKDLTFAQDSHAGLVLWHTPLAVDTAEGITNITWCDWVVKAAQKMQMPIGINDGLERITWAYNRYPDQIIQYHPGFLGGWYGSMNFGEEITSWNGLEAKDQELAEVQASLRQLTTYDNITSWLEPHEEMGHGIADLLVDYGPVADKGYRTFLQEKYGDISTLSKRWYDSSTALKSWDDVRVPELASFLGWGPNAIDLTGLWSVKYGGPFGPEAGSLKLDDSKWPTVPAPDNAIVRFLPRKPAVFRRHIKIDPTWRAAHDQVWLYVWDLNDVRPKKNEMSSVQVYLNGQLLPEVPIKVTQDHWVALNVSDSLKEGDNLVAITLPQGMFNYRVYFSPIEPLLYPNLGAGKNAQWVDFFDWNTWSRVNAVRRGSQMIRQVDPNRGIVLMAPDSYVNGISGVAKEYGGDFHNTGSMAGFWLDSLPSLARGLGLPVSVEPGGPAPTVPSFLSYWGRWLTEGIQGVDYFQHEGDILWKPDIKQCLEDHLSLYTTVGRYHAPTAEAAALYSNHNNTLLEFPWYGGLGYGGSNPLHLGSGYFRWNVRGVLRSSFEMDGLSESSFDRGDAAKYKVIIDTNTSMIDDKLLGDIEKYVRDGGTFVTFVQTGRHTTLARDTWPIEKLTGYHVTNLSQPKAWQSHQLSWAPNQTIFSGTWADKARTDGLSLKKMAPDAQDLAYWKDGSVAIGMRPLGKGFIIEVGCRFTEWGLPDRIDRDIQDYLKKTYNRAKEFGLPDSADEKLSTPELNATTQLFSQILESRHIDRIPAQIAPANEDILMRHYISNNGLYDVWAIWNQSPTQAFKGNLVLNGPTPTWGTNLLDGARRDLSTPQIPLDLPPLETGVYLTPRSDVALSSQSWFELQRNWWQGTADPGPVFPPVENRLAVDLSPDWAFRPLSDNQTDLSDYVNPELDDSMWSHMRFGIFTIPDYPMAHHGLFRKTFIVPANWDHGKVSLWIQSWTGDTLIEKGRIYFDGKMIRDTSSHGIPGDDLGGALKAGTTHQIAVEISGQGTLLGARGPAWIAYHPAPLSSLDLAGKWEVSTDALHYAAPSDLPGPASLANRRTVKIETAQAFQTVVFHAVADNGFLRGVIVNGRFVTRFHHNIGPEINLNITPWIKFGQSNELIMMGGDKGTVKEVSLEFHEKGTYP